VGDVTPPVVTIHSGPAVATTSTTATFSFTVDDPDAVLRCSLDGAPLTFCESPVTYNVAQLALATGTASGPHTFEVEAIKQHLLVEGEPALWEWSVDDQTDPETSIASGPPSEIGLDTPSTFTFSSDEPGVTFECALDPVGVPSRQTRRRPRPRQPPSRSPPTSPASRMCAPSTEWNPCRVRRR
jgi:hypothetical protein